MFQSRRAPAACSSHPSRAFIFNDLNQHCMSSRRVTRPSKLLTLVVLLPLIWDAASAQCGNPPSVQDALRRVNAERARGVVCKGSAGETSSTVTAGPLRWSPGLAAVAAAQADEMVLLHQMSHLDSQNRALAARLSAKGYRFSNAVENVAVGYPSLDMAVDAWLASSTHCINLMNTTVLELGVACSDASPDPHDRYWTLVLGAPQRQ
jgi:uncharacterized protein YkwD